MASERLDYDNKLSGVFLSTFSRASETFLISHQTSVNMILWKMKSFSQGGSKIIHIFLYLVVFFAVERAPSYSMKKKLHHRTRDSTHSLPTWWKSLHLASTSLLPFSLYITHQRKSKCGGKSTTTKCWMLRMNFDTHSPLISHPLHLSRWLCLYFPFSTVKCPSSLLVPSICCLFISTQSNRVKSTRWVWV